MVKKVAHATNSRVECDGNYQGFIDPNDSSYQVNSLIYINVACIVFMIISMTVVIRLFSSDFIKKKIKSSNPLLLIICSLLMILSFGTMSQSVSYYRYQPQIDFYRWFNGLLPVETNQIITLCLVGMGSSIVFGFLDNAGLFFGSNYLDDFFQDLPGASDANVFAGQGNTFSDTVGAFLGTFCGKIINDLAEMDTFPLWCQAIGIVIGCLLGILIPKLILGDSSASHGVNRSVAMSSLLGNFEQADLQQMLTTKKVQTDQLVEVLFKKIDNDESGTLDKKEVLQQLENIGCDSKDNEKFIQQNIKDKSIALKEFKDILMNICQSKLAQAKKNNKAKIE